MPKLHVVLRTLLLVFKFQTSHSADACYATYAPSCQTKRKTSRINMFLALPYQIFREILIQDELQLTSVQVLPFFPLTHLGHHPRHEELEDFKQYATTYV